MEHINDPYDQYDDQGALKPTVEQITEYIDHQKKIIEGWEHQRKLGEAMSRLLKNEDFNFIFTEYYLKDYLNNRLEDLASSITPELEQSAKDKVKAIGVFRLFMKNLLTGIAQANLEIADLESKIKEAELAETRVEL